MTEEFLANLKETVQAAMVDWSKMAFIHDDASQTLQSNAKALGGIDALRQIIAQIEDHQQATPSGVERLEQ